MNEPPITLKRTLSFWQLTLYGVGTILGAGIYVLIGEVAVAAGTWAPLSFMVAAALAAMTGLSFAELSSRYPYSAGEAVYVEEAFGSKRLSTMIALAVVLTGIVSSATLVNGFAGYFHDLFNVSGVAVIAPVCLVLGIVAIWGIAESVSVAVIITVAEILGLIAVVIVATPAAIEARAFDATAQSAADPAVLLGVLSGAGIAFYAFIGFEDMVNVAEEVVDVRRVMPKAIVLTLLVASALYFVVALVVVRALPMAELTSTGAPLARVFANATGSSWPISVIALFAVLNGALIQIVMAARVLYGGAQKGWLPQRLASLHPKTRTPILATALVTALILVFALWLPLGTLARLTALIILIIFAAVNLALARLKTRTGPSEDQGKTYRVPLWIPLVGAVSSLGFAAVNAVALTS